MQLIRKSGSLVKLNLRLAPEMLKAADALRQNRGGHCQRNTWMAEAIAEKLARDNQSGNGGTRDA